MPPFEPIYASLLYHARASSFEGGGALFVDMVVMINSTTGISGFQLTLLELCMHDHCYSFNVLIDYRR